jgi:Fe-S-cluster-containing hydrogenase component 2
VVRLFWHPENPVFPGFFRNQVSKSSKGIPFFPSMWHWFVTSGKALRFFYKTFSIQVDKEVCVKCMRCVDNCPVGAILIESDAPVIHPEQCQSCQRCVAFCPVNAISVPGKPAVQYRAMSFEEFTEQGLF